MNWEPILELATGVRSAKVKAVELVEKSLAKADETKDYKLFISLTKERALERAKVIDDQVAAGNDPGSLAGVPFIAKDNFLTLGGKTTAASNILKLFEAPYQATAIELLEAQGAICIGKSNLDAFAHGSSTENSDFFTTKNPVDKTRVPGGSSGGSAAAVALNVAPFALGTDTGGSIRQPAAFCGVVGFKPTYGLVSRSGVVAMASSADVIGPITRSVKDSAAVLDVIAGRDPLDSTTIERDKSYMDLGSGLKGKKIGLIKEYFDEGLDDGVREKTNQAVERLKQAGAQVEEISMPSVTLALAVYYIICPAEVSSNLARYDGQRFGHYAPDAKNLEESYELAREQGFGAEAKRRIMIGTYVLSSGYYDAYYTKAQLVRTKIINEFKDAFKMFDLLVGPTTPTTAFKIGERAQDPLSMYMSDILTAAANVAGLPSISTPCGEVDGLPVGLQIIGAQTHDRQVLAAADSYEEARR